MKTVKKNIKKAFEKIKKTYEISENLWRLRKLVKVKNSYINLESLLLKFKKTYEMKVKEIYESWENWWKLGKVSLLKKIKKNHKVL